MLRLVPHPDNPPNAISSIKVGVLRRPGGGLMLSYSLFAQRETIVWPGESDSGFRPWRRADELWRHTCFELFLRTPGGCSYLELNFAMGGQWAAYRFTDHRLGMRPVDDVELVKGYWRINQHRGDVNLRLKALAAEDDVWLLNVSAVAEGADRTKSYWALEHSEGPPDFHDPACFVLTLPAPG